MKKYTLTITLGEDDSVNMRSENQGFNIAELVAFLEVKKLDLVAQSSEYANFKRHVMRDDGTKIEIVEADNVVSEGEKHDEV